MSTSVSARLLHVQHALVSKCFTYHLRTSQPRTIRCRSTAASKRRRVSLSASIAFTCGDNSPRLIPTVGPGTVLCHLHPPPAKPLVCLSPLRRSALPSPFPHSCSPSSPPSPSLSYPGCLAGTTPFSLSVSLRPQACQLCAGCPHGTSHGHKWGPRLLARNPLPLGRLDCDGCPMLPFLLKFLSEGVAPVVGLERNRRSLAREGRDEHQLISLAHSAKSRSLFPRAVCPPAETALDAYPFCCVLGNEAAASLVGAPSGLDLRGCCILLPLQVEPAEALVDDSTQRFQLR